METFALECNQAQLVIRYHERCIDARCCAATCLFGWSSHLLMVVACICCRQWHRNQDGVKVAAEDIYVVRDTSACPNKAGQGLVAGGGASD